MIASAYQLPTWSRSEPGLWSDRKAGHRQRHTRTSDVRHVCEDALLEHPLRCPPSSNAAGSFSALVHSSSPQLRSWPGYPRAYDPVRSPVLISTSHAMAEIQAPNAAQTATASSRRRGDRLRICSESKEKSFNTIEVSSQLGIFYQAKIDIAESISDLIYRNPSASQPEAL